ncbi:MAG: hypothetical protein NTZ13_00860 [Candidatus Parcubacteria bacterium]|nr:hypothetical protein [Candidatus Parcubacteria bacterium]
MKYGELNLEQIEAIVNKLGGMEGVRKFLGEEIIVTPISSIIYVDCTIPANYPKWVGEVLYPDLESTVPTEFYADKLLQWLHDGQKNGYVTGNTIHKFLKDYGMIKNCLGLRDLEEIQKKGITFFRKYFKSKYVFGWKSVVRDLNGCFYTPSLFESFESDDIVELNWSWLGCGWNSNDPALCIVS